MTYLARNIDAELLKWKDSPRRKPLLVRGARQVGKSWAIRHLGETFKHYLEINLDLVIYFSVEGLDSAAVDHQGLA